MLKITNSQDFLMRIRPVQPEAPTQTAPAAQAQAAGPVDQARVSTDIAAPGEAPLADGSEQLPELWHLSPQQEARYRGAEKNIATAKTPDELDHALTTAKNLAAEYPDQQEFKDLEARARGAADGVRALNDAAAKLGGTATDRAAATAALLARGDGMVSESPLAQQALSNVQSKLGDASPDTLAAQLRQEPDLSKYPPGMAADLVTLAGVPQVGAVLPAVADTLANKGVDLQTVMDEPALGQLLTAASDQGKVQGIVAGWAKQSLDRNLEGKNHDSVKQGLDGFKQEMQGLADATGLGPLMAPAADQVLKDNKGEIDHVANKDKGFLDHVGDLAGDLTGALGSVIDVAGHAIQNGAHVLGVVNGLVVKAEGQLAGGALDLVGAHGLADKARDASETLADQEGAFIDGAGAALGGTVSGVGTIVRNPMGTVKGLVAMVRDPSLIPKVGAAIWDQASKGGLAYAAGYVAGTVVPAILSGGGTAGEEAAAEVAVEATETLAARAGEEAVEQVLEQGASSLSRNALDKLVAAGKAVGRDAVTDGKDVATAVRALWNDSRTALADGVLREGAVRQIFSRTMNGDFSGAADLVTASGDQAVLVGKASEFGTTVASGVSGASELAGAVLHPLKFVNRQIGRRIFENFEDRIPLSASQRAAADAASKFIQPGLKEAAR